MRIPLQNGEILMGSISWQKAYSYTWRGKAYIEVPYVFNGVEKIIQGTDTTSYSLVLCVLNKDYFVGAINTRTYTLLDGTEANTWLNDGSRLKSIKSVSRSEKEIAALDAQIKEARKNKKEGNTTVRKAINPIEEEICETYTYSEISPSSGNIDYYGEGSYDFVDTLNKDLENVTVNGYIKQKTVSYCFTEIKGDGFPPPPPLPSGGGSGDDTSKDLPTPWDCDCNCSEENTEMIDASLAFEPKWGQLGSKEDIVSEVIRAFYYNKLNESSNFENRLIYLSQWFHVNRSFTRNKNNLLVDKDGSVARDRYIYTIKRGWIDMHHFFYSALLSEMHGTTISDYITTLGEFTQKYTDVNSSYSYEDLASNKAGRDFYEAFHSKIKNNQIEFANAINEFLLNAEAVPPFEAPNFDYISHISDDKVLKSNNSSGLVGNELKQKAKITFCKRNLDDQNKIKEAHKEIPYSSKKGKIIK